MDRQVPDLTAVFTCGQSVVVKVMQVKEENQRFLCSLRMCDCYSDDPAVGLELLNNYFRERELWTHTILEEKGLFPAYLYHHIVPLTSPDDLPIRSLG